MLNDWKTLVNYKCKSENFDKIQNYLLSKGYTWRGEKKYGKINIDLNNVEFVYISVRDEDYMTQSTNPFQNTMFEEYSIFFKNIIDLDRLLKMKKLL